MSAPPLERADRPSEKPAARARRARATESRFAFRLGRSGYRPESRLVDTWVVRAQAKRVLGAIAAGALVVGVAVGATVGRAEGAAAPGKAATPGVAAALDAVISTGVSGAVVYVRDGARTALLARGFSDPHRHVAMRVGDRFRIGTVTRSFVATAVLQLVAAHRLGLDERVDRAAPGLLPKRDGAITVRQLLQGTSGLWDYLQAPPWNHIYREAAFRRTWTPRQLLAIGVSHKPYASPGAVLDAWSSTPWIALGLIVERVTGQRLGAVLRERIFTPLGLRATSFSPGTATPKGLAHGWARNGVDVTAVNSSWAWANGAIVSTASDVARFYRALLRGRLLPRSLMKQMETVRWLNRYLIGVGFGLGLERTKTLMLAKHLPTMCRVAWGYEGTHLGYTIEALSSIDGRRQVVIMLNEDPGAVTPDWQAPSALFHLADKALCT